MIKVRSRPKSRGSLKTRIPEIWSGSEEGRGFAAVLWYWEKLEEKGQTFGSWV